MAERPDSAVHQQTGSSTSTGTPTFVPSVFSLAVETHERVGLNRMLSATLEVPPAGLGRMSLGSNLEATMGDFATKGRREERSAGHMYAPAGPALSIEVRQPRGGRSSSPSAFHYPSGGVGTTLRRSGNAGSLVRPPLPAPWGVHRGGGQRSDRAGNIRFAAAGGDISDAAIGAAAAALSRDHGLSRGRTRSRTGSSEGGGGLGIITGLGSPWGDAVSKDESGTSADDVEAAFAAALQTSFDVAPGALSLRLSRSSSRGQLSSPPTGEAGGGVGVGSCRGLHTPHSRSSSSHSLLDGSSSSPKGAHQTHVHAHVGVGGTQPGPLSSTAARVGGRAVPLSMPAYPHSPPSRAAREMGTCVSEVSDVSGDEAAAEGEAAVDVDMDVDVEGGAAKGWTARQSPSGRPSVPLSPSGTTATAGIGCTAQATQEFSLTSLSLDTFTLGMGELGARGGSFDEGRGTTDRTGRRNTAGSWIDTCSVGSHSNSTSRRGSDVAQLSVGCTPPVGVSPLGSPIGNASSAVVTALAGLLGSGTGVGARSAGDGAGDGPSLALSRTGSPCPLSAAASFSSGSNSYGESDWALGMKRPTERRPKERVPLEPLGSKDPRRGASQGAAGRCPVCTHCSARFTLLSRRHMCRGCGAVLCDSCTPYQAGDMKRICKRCNALRQGRVLRPTGAVQDVLHWLDAVATGDLIEVETRLAMGVDVNACDAGDGLAALHVAAGYGSYADHRGSVAGEMAQRLAGSEGDRLRSAAQQGLLPPGPLKRIALGELPLLPAGSGDRAPSAGELYTHHMILEAATTAANIALAVSRDNSLRRASIESVGSGSVSLPDVLGKGASWVGPSSPRLGPSASRAPPAPVSVVAMSPILASLGSIGSFVHAAAGKLSSFSLGSSAVGIVASAAGAMVAGAGGVDVSDYAVLSQVNTSSTLGQCQHSGGGRATDTCACHPGTSAVMSPAGSPDRHGSAPVGDQVAEKTALALVKLLIQAGADVSQCTSSGRTPLHMAVLHGSLAVLHVLLDAGALQSAADKNGFTPHDYASLRAACGCVQAIDMMSLLDPRHSTGIVAAHSALTSSVAAASSTGGGQGRGRAYAQSEPESASVSSAPRVEHNGAGEEEDADRDSLPVYSDGGWEDEGQGSDPTSAGVSSGEAVEVLHAAGAIARVVALPMPPHAQIIAAGVLHLDPAAGALQANLLAVRNGAERWLQEHSWLDSFTVGTLSASDVVQSTGSWGQDELDRSYSAIAFRPSVRSKSAALGMMPEFCAASVASFREIALVGDVWRVGHPVNAEADVTAAVEGAFRRRLGCRYAAPAGIAATLAVAVSGYPTAEVGGVEDSGGGGGGTFGADMFAQTDPSAGGSSAALEEEEDEEVSVIRRTKFALRALEMGGIEQSPPPPPLLSMPVSALMESGGLAQGTVTASAAVTATLDVPAMAHEVSTGHEVTGEQAVAANVQQQASAETTPSLPLSLLAEGFSTSLGDMPITGLMQDAVRDLMSQGQEQQALELPCIVGADSVGGVEADSIVPAAAPIPVHAPFAPFAPFVSPTDILEQGRDVDAVSNFSSAASQCAPSVPPPSPSLTSSSGRPPSLSNSSTCSGGRSERSEGESPQTTTSTTRSSRSSSFLCDTACSALLPALRLGNTEDMAHVRARLLQVEVEREHEEAFGLPMATLAEAARAAASSSVPPSVHTTPQLGGLSVAGTSSSAPTLSQLVAGLCLDAQQQGTDEIVPGMSMAVSSSSGIDVSALSGSESDPYKSDLSGVSIPDSGWEVPLVQGAGGGMWRGGAGRETGSGARAGMTSTPPDLDSVAARLSTQLSAQRLNASFDSSAQSSPNMGPCNRFDKTAFGSAFFQSSPDMGSMPMSSPGSIGSGSSETLFFNRTLSQDLVLAPGQGLPPAWGGGSNTGSTNSGGLSKSSTAGDSLDIRFTLPAPIDGSLGLHAAWAGVTSSSGLSSAAPSPGRQPAKSILKRSSVGSLSELVANGGPPPPGIGGSPVVGGISAGIVGVEGQGSDRRDRFASNASAFSIHSQQQSVFLSGSRTGSFGGDDVASLSLNTSVGSISVGLIQDQSCNSTSANAVASGGNVHSGIGLLTALPLGTLARLPAAGTGSVLFRNSAEANAAADLSERLGPATFALLARARTGSKSSLRRSVSFRDALLEGPPFDPGSCTLTGDLDATDSPRVDAGQGQHVPMPVEWSSTSVPAVVPETGETPTPTPKAFASNIGALANAGNAVERGEVRSDDGSWGEVGSADESADRAAIEMDPASGVGAVWAFNFADILDAAASESMPQVSPVRLSLSSTSLGPAGSKPSAKAAAVKVRRRAVSPCGFSGAHTSRAGEASSEDDDEEAEEMPRNWAAKMAATYAQEESALRVSVTGAPRAGVASVPASLPARVNVTMLQARPVATSRLATSAQRVGVDEDEGEGEEVSPETRRLFSVTDRACSSYSGRVSGSVGDVTPTPTLTLSPRALPSTSATLQRTGSLHSAGSLSSHDSGSGSIGLSIRLSGPSSRGFGLGLQRVGSVQARRRRGKAEEGEEDDEDDGRQSLSARSKSGDCDGSSDSDGSTRSGARFSEDRGSSLSRSASASASGSEGSDSDDGAAAAPKAKGGVGCTSLVRQLSQQELHELMLKRSNSLGGRMQTAGVPLGLGLRPPARSDSAGALFGCGSGSSTPVATDPG